MIHLQESAYSGGSGGVFQANKPEKLVESLREDVGFPGIDLLIPSCDLSASLKKWVFCETCICRVKVIRDSEWLTPERPSARSPAKPEAHM